MRTFLAMSVLAAALVSSSATAQAPAPGTVLLSLSGGAAMPLGDLGDFAGTGLAFGGSAEFGAGTLPFVLRLDLAYNKFGQKEATVSDGTTTFNVESDVSNFNVTFNAVMGASAAAQVRPYALGGIGFYNTTFDLAASGGGFSFSGDDSKGSFGLNGGAGIRFRMGTLSTFVEGRYHYVMDGVIDAESDSDEIEYKGASYFPIVFGISFGR